MLRWIIVILGICWTLSSCEDNSEACAGPLFHPGKKTAYILENEPMTLKKATTPDTSFLYLEWLNEEERPILLIFDPQTALLSNAESRTRFNVTAEVKISCPQDPTINGELTSVINVINAEKLEYCEVNVDQNAIRPLEQTYWRFIGFWQKGELLPPTCEENFLYIIFTNSQVNPVRPDNRYFAEIFSGARDCVYIYEFLSPGTAQIREANCYRLDIAATKGSRLYGERFLENLLDPDTLFVDHNGPNLIIRPKNFDEELVFVGL